VKLLWILGPSQIGLTLPTQDNSAAVKGHDGNRLLDVTLNYVVNVYRVCENVLNILSRHHSFATLLLEVENLVCTRIHDVISQIIVA